MSKFFLPRECIQGDLAIITGQEAHHILDVMRMKPGERIEAFDGHGFLYRGYIMDTAHKKVKLKIEKRLKNPLASDVKVSLIQALPKRQKMDYIIEKCTELGVDAVIPLETARTIVKLDKAKELARQKRWQKIAQEAAKQCGRTTVPQIQNLASWKNLWPLVNNCSLKLVACLAEETKNIKAVLRSQSPVKEVAVMIGPEGDFTADEIEQAKDNGFIAVSLGNNVLKSDTAGVCVLSIINYELRL